MNIDQPPRTESSENRGKNVEILLRLMRHGERDIKGRLTEYGKKVTAKKAKEDAHKYAVFTSVKPIGSEAGKKGGFGARSLETAEIFAHTINPDTPYNTRPEEALNYETLINPAPHDHVAIYNANLPANFKELTDEQKSKAAKLAQKATLNHLLSLKTPEAIVFTKEVAGSFAYVIKHYKNIAERLKEGSKVLIPAGTHGGTMELLLKLALVQEVDGQRKIGFSNIDEIGGEFSPSDGYDVDISTDEEGKLKKLLVSFDDDRHISKDAYLDPAVIDELAEYYESLHFPK